MTLRAAFLGLGGVLLAQSGLAQSLPGTPNGDPEAGRRKAGVCRTCHGIDGFARIPVAPHIGGEPADYLVRQLTAFRDGTRQNEMMSVVAKGLDDQTIADLAAWYSSMRIEATLPDGVSPDAAPELCIACHGANGTAVIEDAPHLAGENVIYIDTQLKAFRTGKRVHEIMSAVAADLTDQQIRAFAEWYSAVKLTIEPVD